MSYSDYIHCGKYYWTLLLAVFLRNKPVPIDSFVRQSGLSRNVFFVRFRSRTGMSPKRYMLEVIHARQKSTENGFIMGFDSSQDMENGVKLCIIVELNDEERAIKAWNILKDGGTICP